MGCVVDRSTIVGPRFLRSEGGVLFDAHLPGQVGVCDGARLARYPCRYLAVTTTVPCMNGWMEQM
jgi:hypothetical protein